MVTDAVLIAWWKRPLYLFLAYAYYRAVRWFGGKAFHSTDEPRGRVELDEVMGGLNDGWR